MISFCLIAFVLVARYALVLCLARKLFQNMDQESRLIVWLGLQPEPNLYPGMSYSQYFLYDFVIVLVSFFYQRHIVTSSRFSCVASDKDVPAKSARHSLLAEYAKFAVRILYDSESAGINTRRFSFFRVYRQFCLNYDRISAFVGMFVLLYTTIDNFPSLPNLVITVVLTLTLIQFGNSKPKSPNTDKDSIKRKLD